jgi:hypothetical protein
MITHLSYAFPYVADASIMIVKEIGEVGIVVEWRWVENVAAGFVAMDFLRRRCR